MALGRWQRVGIGVFALAVVVGDVAVLPHITHQRDVKAATKKRIAYLGAARASVQEAYVALRPLENVVTAQSSDETDGIDYPARDALAHTSAVATFAAAATAFDKVAVPKDMKVKATAISAALHSLATDTKGFAALSGATGDTLADAFATGTFSDLSNDMINLNTAVTGAYGPDRVTAPSMPTTVPASHDSWLFGADLACLSGEKALEPRIDSDNETLAQLENDLAITVAAGRATNAAVRKVPVPASDPKAKALVQRLTVLDRLVAAQAALLSAARAQNESGIDAAEAQADADSPDLAALGKQFIAYGASECGNFYNVDTGSTSSNSGGGSTSGGQAA